MVVAAGLVGSGELIATTKAGAQAGISLLWIIVLGCVLKVFTQIELGRYTVSTGETALTAINRIPGPRLRVNSVTPPRDRGRRPPPAGRCRAAA